MEDSTTTNLEPPIWMVLCRSSYRRTRYSTTTALVQSRSVHKLAPTLEPPTFHIHTLYYLLVKYSTYDTGNQHGAHEYLWSTYTQTKATTYSYTSNNGSIYSFNTPANSPVWQMYEAFTGKWICNIANVPSSGAQFAASTRYVGPNGEELIYVYDQVNGWLTLWNSSVALSFPNNNLGVPYSAYQSAEAFYWMLREPIGDTVDGTNGYSWNITAPKNLGSITNILSDR